jgi:hypothetical protein
MRNLVIKTATLCIILCALLFTINSCKDSDSILKETELQEPATHYGELTWDYPVKPGTAEWKQFQSNEEMVRACQIPEDVLTYITTEELADICLQYPLLYDVFAFNGLSDGLDKLFSDFNGIRELYKRNDVSSNLIKRYSSKVQNFSFLEGTNPDVEKGFFIISVSALEVLLSRVEIQNQQKEILQNLVAGYEEKMKYADHFKGFGFRTNLYSRGHVILKIDNSSIDAENSILFSGMGDEQSVNIVDKLSYQFIN